MKQNKKITLTGILSLKPKGKGLQSRQAFTLVELIVVITILAILGTIAFISLQGYSADARDSSRISDVNHIKTSLELFSLDTGKYPLPDGAQDVTLTGTTVIVWKQGTVGNIVTGNLSRNLNEKPTDPLYETEYIYSTLENGSKYEVMSVYEGDLAFFMTQTNAASTPTVRIDGTYNGLYIKTGDYIIPTPSIITALDPTGLYLDLTTIKSQVINEGTNVPNIGTSKIAQKTGELTFTNFQVYNTPLDKDSAPSEFLAAYNVLYDTYTGSSLANQGLIQALLMQTTDDEKINFTKTVILNTTVASTTPIITATCSDGIQNQDETGVDCGGTCGACPITCPTGYVLVPGNSTFSTSDFCVAKYEMKNVGGVATSQASGTPWVSITQPSAITACNTLGTGYHLITNNEWMTIARNIEANAVNWEGGVAGTNYIYSGHNDNSPANSLSASTNDLDGYNQTLNAAGNQKRTLTLSNGEVIWDLAGNVREHVNGTNVSSSDGVVTSGQACSTTASNWYSFYGSDTAAGGTCSFISPYSKANHGPLGDYNANHGVGRIYSSTLTNRIFIRGGDWSNATAAGVFALSLAYDSSGIYTAIGFRCAFSVN